jgi:nucleotide-binding universal stress UspA family protein
MLLISGRCDHPWPEQGPLRMLVPLDGSAFAEAALKPVNDFAAALPVELLLVAAAGPLEHGYSDGPRSVQAGFDAGLRTAHAYLEKIAGRLRADGRKVDLIARFGSAGPIIAAVARERSVDLIAMATHGRSGVAQLALGSVATETLQRADVPLLLTRPVAAIEATKPAGEAARSPVPRERAW